MCSDIFSQTTLIRYWWRNIVLYASSQKLHVSICVSATCAISNKSGTILHVDINQSEMMQMLGKFVFSVIHIRRFQIWD